MTVLTYLKKLWRSPLNRMAIVLSLGLFVACLGALVLTAHFVAQQVAKQSEALIRAEIEGLDEVYEDTDIPGLVAAINERLQRPQDPHAIYALLDAKGQVLAGHLAQAGNLGQVRGWFKFDLVANEQARAVLAFAQELEEGEVLIAGRDNSEQQRIFAEAYDVSFALFVVLALIALAIGFSFRKAVDRALQEPIAVVAHFSHGQLHSRVKRDYSEDSFDQVNAALNQMLDRVQDLVRGVMQSTDAIAHDLRTPLTRLRTQLEALQNVTQSEQAVLATQAAVREADSLLARFGALLRLARIESAEAIAHSPINLTAIAQDAAEFWRPMAEEKQQELLVDLVAGQARAQAAAGGSTHTSAIDYQIQGDRDLLFQLISNLLENAVKYAPVGGQIKLALASAAPDDELNDQRQAAVLLSVSDNGPGVPEADHARIFDRFVRLESHRSQPGFGLGLSLVRAIAVQHRARWRLRDAKPGLSVEILFLLDAS